MPTTTHRKLAAWNLAMDLVVEIYRLTTLFPADERFGLTAQVRRAAVSIASNLAEGNERTGRADKARFATIARSSVAEVETQVELAVRLRMIEARDAAEAFEMLDHVGRMITRLRWSLER